MKNTRDLAQFGHVERKEAGRLLSALSSNKDKTVHFQHLGVAVEFNPMSGYVFLVDEDYNVAIMNGDELEDFHTCPNCGGEGVASDFRQDNEAECCQEYADDMEL